MKSTAVKLTQFPQTSLFSGEIVITIIIIVLSILSASPHLSAIGSHMKLRLNNQPVKDDACNPQSGSPFVSADNTLSLFTAVGREMGKTNAAS